jgi:hypothetical protein
MVLTLFGSDVYRTHWPLSILQRRLLLSGDLFTASNPHTLASARARFRLRLEPCVDDLLFGLRSLDHLAVLDHGDRTGQLEGLGIPPGRTIVTCGYNGSVNQDHLAVLDALGRCPAEVRAQFHVVLPMMIGGADAYRRGVKERAISLGLDHTVLEHRLTDEQVAMLRSVTDVFIQVQRTDQLSASMLEHLYAGSVVITGGWLPYGQLTQRGIRFWTTPSIEQLTSELIACLDQLPERRAAVEANRDLVRRLASWSVTAPRWSALYDGPVGR